MGGLVTVFLVITRFICFGQLWLLFLGLCSNYIDLYMRAKKLATVVKRRRKDWCTKTGVWRGNSISASNRIWHWTLFEQFKYILYNMSLNLCLKDTMKYDQCVFKYNSTAWYFLRWVHLSTCCNLHLTGNKCEHNDKQANLHNQFFKNLLFSVGKEGN